MTDTHDTKVCSKCGLEKTLDCFSKDKYKKSGFKPSCKECCNSQYSIWHDANRKYLIERYKEYNIKNKENISIRKKLYIKENREKRNKSKRFYTKNKYHNCKLYKLKQNVRNLINSSISKRKLLKNKLSIEIVGCSWNELLLHIERQFTDGMCWERRSEIHIDHIIPLASAKTEEDVIRLNHFTNLRPLWAKDNLSKGAKMEHLI